MVTRSLYVLRIYRPRSVLELRLITELYMMFHLVSAAKIEVILYKHLWHGVQLLGHSVFPLAWYWGVTEVKVKLQLGV